MSLFDNMPDEYQFSEADIHAHMKLFVKIMNEEDLTPEEQEFYDVTDDADRLRWIIKRLPTMGELRKYWEDQDAKQQA
jgi:hypothetical protein